MCRTRRRRFDTTGCRGDVIATMEWGPKLCSTILARDCGKVCREDSRKGLGAGYQVSWGNWSPDVGRRTFGNSGFLVVFRLPTLLKVKIPTLSRPRTAGQGWGNLGVGDQPARRRDSVRWMVEMREMAATIMLESSCMVATSRSSKAPGEEDKTSKTPRVRR